MPICYNYYMVTLRGVMLWGIILVIAMLPFVFSGDNSSIDGNSGIIESSIGLSKIRSSQEISDSAGKDILSQLKNSKVDKKVLEDFIGESLPDGIEARFELFPAGCGAWQLDDEYRLQLRLAHFMRETEKSYCKDLARRNDLFRRMLN